MPQGLAGIFSLCAKVCIFAEKRAFLVADLRKARRGAGCSHVHAEQAPHQCRRNRPADLTSKGIAVKLDAKP